MLEKAQEGKFYSSGNLNKALADLQEGQSYHSVSRKYAIPRRTLQRHMKGTVRDSEQFYVKKWRPKLSTMQLTCNNDFMV